LSEHRLSLGAFGPALRELESAVKRTASGMLRDATDGEYGKKGGRYHKVAEALDVQLAGIEGGSLTTTFVLALQFVLGQQTPLFDLVTRETALRFVRDVKDEGHGQPRNSGVRKFLEALPDLTRHKYEVLQDGETIESAELGKLEIAIVPGRLPSFLEIVGFVVSVGFAPGPPEIKLRREGRTLRVRATPAQVDAALAFRGAEVRALAIDEEGGPRLLRLDAVQAGINQFDELVVVFERWDGLLKRLAQ